MTEAALTRARWRKSSRSNSAPATCVELAALPSAVAVRDSKDPEGPKLLLSPVAWANLASAIKTGQFDA
ncbi:DUF397 domain-containing protein [Actinomadura sp. NBRC 104425]|uniref:DUF397 domain-containing protein n=1 Tax=Actinomadura sp. NBRC 104425 TaxID=3032204 RepID=UPI0024A3D3CA|nr:DUF397 domain-containing protein [Actinomadura sp. NBRC 104425]GLZ13018.1 DUF397 domain-containing protein [Actinomadura sp. NBRC 104425]